MKCYGEILCETLWGAVVCVLGRCGVVVYVLCRSGVVVCVLGRCGVVVCVLGRCGVVACHCFGNERDLEVECIVKNSIKLSMMP